MIMEGNRENVIKITNKNFEFNGPGYKPGIDRIPQAKRERERENLTIIRGVYRPIKTKTRHLSVLTH